MISDQWLLLLLCACSRWIDLSSDKRCDYRYQYVDVSTLLSVIFLSRMFVLCVEQSCQVMEMSVWKIVNALIPCCCSNRVYLLCSTNHMQVVTSSSGGSVFTSVVFATRAHSHTLPERSSDCQTHTHFDACACRASTTTKWERWSRVCIVSVLSRRRNVEWWLHITILICVQMPIRRSRHDTILFLVKTR